MNASEAANWFNHATPQDQEEFLNAIFARKINGHLWQVGTRTEQYFAEEKAREARTVIPEGRANRDPC